MINVDAIPQKLKDRPQWVCWSLEEREGKSTKVPKNPRTGGNAMANDPATWGEFDLAVSHLEAHKNNGIAGIGYEFGVDDPFTGVDLDKIRNAETGEIDPGALEIVKHLNSYTEVSPSGTGLHIWIKGKLPPGARRKGKVEMYDTARYFTVTGYHFEGTPFTIEPRQAELGALHAEIFGKPSEGSKQGPGRSTKEYPGYRSKLSDDDLIDKIRRSKNGNKFAELMRGDIDYLKHQCGYPSASEADLALVMILAFWTGKDAEQIDQIFRKSGLMRPKWDEPRKDLTYGRKTIEKAIASTTEVWKGAKKQRQRNKKQNDTFKKDTPQSLNMIDELNKKHAVVMIGGKCVIMNEVIDPVFNRPDVTFSSIYDFRNYYSNLLITFVDDDGTSKKVPLSAEWLASLRRRQYEGIAFAPGRDIPGFYNLFRGFAVAPVIGDWSLLRKHILHNICRGNAELFYYVLQWMARNVQEPGGERPGVAVVLKSPERGTGKGVYVTQYGKIFGNHFKHITQTSQVVGRFNSHLKDCLLLFVDEGVWGGDRPAEGVLKGLITEPQIMIEPKGINAFPVENHINFMIASNNEWVVPAGFEERRFLVLDVSPEHKQDTEYFGAIVDQMDRGGRAAMLYDLLEMKITLDLRKVPRTQALLDQVVHGMSTVQKFWFEKLRAGDEYHWPEFELTEYVHGEYLEFADTCGDRYKLIDSLFGVELRRLCPALRHVRKRISNDRKWVYFWPKLEHCRSYFEKAIGIPVDWSTDPGPEGEG